MMTIDNPTWGGWFGTTTEYNRALQEEATDSDATVAIPTGAGSDVGTTQQWDTDVTMRLPGASSLPAPADPSGSRTAQIVYVPMEVRVPVRVPTPSVQRERPTSLIATGLLMVLSVSLAVTFGFVNGWTANSVLLLAIASCLHGAAVAGFKIDIKGLRISIMVFSITVGLGFLFAGMGYGLSKTVADFMHAHGII